MKRKLSYLVILCMVLQMLFCVTLVAQASDPANDVTFTAGSAEGKVGDRVKIPFSITTTVAKNTYVADIIYDKTQLKFIQFTDFTTLGKSDLVGGDACYADERWVTIIFMWEHADLYTGELCSAEFEILAESDTPYTVSLLPDPENQGFYSNAAVVDGTVTVLPDCEHTNTTPVYVDGTNHKYVCDECDKQVGELEGHDEEEIPAVDASCTEKGATAGVKCSVCDAVLTAPTETDKLEHKATVGADWESDETYHWHVCATCPEVLDRAIHTDNEVAGICDVCGEAFETIKNGLWSDDRFYENNVLITNYRIYEYEGDTYFIGDNHRITKSQALYLTNGVNGWTGATGYYGFDEDGKLCVAGSGNVVCAPYAFTDGVQVKAYGAFETRDGEWYFVNDGYRIATNKAFRIQLPGEASLRYHYFGVDGKLYTETTVMFEERIYIDGIQQGYGLYLAYEVKADGTLADEAKYYYVNDHHIIARDKWLYVNNPEFGAVRYYYFDENGYIDVNAVKPQ